LKKQDAIEDKDKVELLDLVLNNFNKIVEEVDINKLFKTIISHVEIIKFLMKIKGEITVNFP
jgi:hypothetical protein